MKGDWDDWAAAEDSGGPAEQEKPSKKVILVVVLGIAMLGSIVLCCVAAGQLGRLFWFDVPPP